MRTPLVVPRRPTWLAGPLLAVVLTACVHDEPLPIRTTIRIPPRTSQPEASAETQGGETAAAPEAGGSSIRRADLAGLLDAGFGRFLSLLRVEAVLDHGRFVGFRFEEWRDPAHRFDTVALRPGDVIVRVNGLPIERPEQAFIVWNGLRVTSELCIEYLRGSERREIRYTIVD